MERTNEGEMMDLRERIENRIAELRKGNAEDAEVLARPGDVFSKDFAARRINRRSIIGEELETLIKESE